MSEQSIRIRDAHTLDHLDLGLRRNQLVVVDQRRMGDLSG